MAMIAQVLRKFGLEEDTAQLSAGLIYLPVAVFAFLAGTVGPFLPFAADVNWTNAMTGALGLVMLFAVGEFLSGLQKQEAYLRSVAGGVEVLAKSLGRHLPLLTEEEYIKLAGTILRTHAGDIAFVNVHLKMFNEEAIFKRFWVDGLLKNPDVSSVVIVAAAQGVDVPASITAADDRSKTFKNWRESGKVTVKDWGNLNLPFQFGGLLSSHKTPHGVARELDHAFFLISYEPFADNEGSYNGFFLHLSRPRGGPDREAMPLFQKLEKLAATLHS